MALEAKLLQKLGQNLLMTPQLQQAIKLLQLGRLEYKEAIEKELLENPILEEVKESEDDSRSSKAEERVELPIVVSESEAVSHDESGANKDSPVPWEEYLENYTDARGAAAPRGSYDYEDRPGIEATLTRAETLVEYLVSQVRMRDLREEDASIALNIIGNLDKDGYLCASYDEIASDSSSTVDDVERVMSTIRSCDPPGVGARDLGECLLIQLEHIGLGEGLEAKIVKDHLDKLERRRYDQIAKTEQVALEEVYKAVSAIQHLEPRPARNFADDTVRYIVPDIYVYKVGSEYVISLNEDGLPKLRVSPYYLEIMRRKDSGSKENQEYLQERLKAASWLIKSIHQRQQTIYRVTESIIKFQREFLEHGVSKLKPLVLKDIAEDIDMHESTVSRVTTNKYVHTPQGVFELKYFFSTGLKGAEGDVSSSSVKERIRNIISQESPENPISDQQIVEMLAKENIEIARRTVAKYRESLGILSSSKRKRLF